MELKDGSGVFFLVLYAMKGAFIPEKEESCQISLSVLSVVHPFDAQAQGELSLAVDDYMIVRQVAGTGWSEGEYKGKAGWFPSAYVEKQEKARARKIVEANPKEQ